MFSSARCTWRSAPCTWSYRGAHTRWKWLWGRYRHTPPPSQTSVGGDCLLGRETCSFRCSGIFYTSFGLASCSTPLLLGKRSQVEVEEHISWVFSIVALFLLFGSVGLSFLFFGNTRTQFPVLKDLIQAELNSQRMKKCEPSHRPEIQCRHQKKRPGRKPPCQKDS